MTETTAKAAIGETTKAFLARTEIVWGGAVDRLLELFHDGIQNYLERYQARFSWTKTFLHRDPVYFYDIYFPLRITRKNKEISVNNYNDVLSIAQCVGIVGAAGSGKSTLMRHLFMNVIQKGENELPLFIELRKITGNGNILSYIEAHAIGGGIVLTRNAVSKLLDEGRVILFLDGFDEVAAESYSGIVQSIDEIATRYPKIKMVLTGRPGSRVDAQRGFECVQVAKLNTADIRRFITSQKLGVEIESRILQLVEQISKERRTYLTDFLSNPLLLSLFILTCTTTKQLPDRKSAFYRRVVDTLFVEHDSVTKPDYDRQLRSGLSQVKFEQLLQKFAAISFFHSKFVFDMAYVSKTFDEVFKKSKELEADSLTIARDLVVGVGLWTEDGGQYSFAHRSIQEYFAAAFISSLTSSKKEEAYKRFLMRMSGGVWAEVDNFLSLCAELDEQAYIRYLILPVIKSARSVLESGSHEYVAARVARGVIAKVIWRDPAILPSKREKRVSPSILQGLAWMVVDSSDILGVGLVFPWFTREFVRQVVVDELTPALVRSKTPSTDSNTLRRFGRGAQVFNIREDFPENRLEALLKSPKVMRFVDGAREFFVQEERRWQKRLTELDSADACLIAELL